MREILLGFLSGFEELTKEQIQEMSQLMSTSEYKKNEIVVREGQPCSLCYFVLKGCLRQYVVVDGVEKTISIYTENQAVNYYTNQGTQHKADSYLTCIENSVLVVGNPEKDVELFSKYPALATITRKND